MTDPRELFVAPNAKNTATHDQPSQMLQKKPLASRYQERFNGANQAQYTTTKANSRKIAFGSSMDIEAKNSSVVASGNNSVTRTSLPQRLRGGQHRDSPSDGLGMFNIFATLSGHNV